MGPFELPWGTFAALLVVAASVVIAGVWAMRPDPSERRDRSDESGGGERRDP